MKRNLLLIMVFLASALFAEARKVSGRVESEGKAVSGVIVTDGKNFTRTGINGNFRMNIGDSTEFVYIVTPSGHIADWSSGVPAFYQPAKGRRKFVFDLQKTVDSDDYHIVAIADPQTYSDAHFDEFAGQPLADIAAIAKTFEAPSVGLALGDISWDRIEILDKYKKAIVRAGIPFYPVVGNHDNEAYIEGDGKASATYRSKMGPENYAFFLGSDIVIVLDNIIYETNFKCRIGYIDEVVEWVENLVTMLPQDAGIYVAHHSPLGHGGRRIINGDRLLEALRGHEVTFLSGHTHVNGNHIIGEGITEHNVAAICGAWWETAHCTDGTPRGYKVFTKTAGELSWYYKPVGYDKDHIAEAFAPGCVADHPEAFVVNVWDWDPMWKVEWYEDGKYMGEMTPVKAVSPIFSKEISDAYRNRGEEIPRWKRARPSSHNFSAVPSPEARTVTITVRSRFGQVWTRSFEVE